ncbi:MAG: sugar phosphate isomerase/epimerase [Lachnospiraceae bacterium]|nr:sugar phosphate isomerase/epimerase [Lachnospiraceae bacterium]
MITVGVQTKGLLPELPIEEAFDKIAKAGFTCIDLNLDAFLTSADVYKGNINKFFDAPIEDLLSYFGQYRQAMDDRGIRASQMHSVYPFLVPDRHQQNIYMQQVAIPKSILIAEAMDIPWVVIHPCKLRYEFGVDREFEENLKYYSSLIPFLKEHHVGICVENLYTGIGPRTVEGPCANPQEAIGYIDVLNEEAGEELFGLCLDTGHLQLVKREPYEYITTVGSRLKVLHLHENDVADDLHQMPFTFGRTEQDGLHWDNIAQALREIAFDGTLSYETHPCMRAFPASVQDVALQTICMMGNQLKREIKMEK